ncbi:M48 family metallopeptidase [Candidatus Woesearchaeota archaeon]|nr:M48 family metallopeptidase [Candidatus Woesearchaeota archaeon]
MAKDKFSDDLLESKRKKFFEAVHRICKRRKLPIPDLNFNGCSEESDDELAHYHPGSNTICVSKQKLVKLNFNDIEEVAAHEVSHIVKADHSPEFYRQEEVSKVAGFHAGPGVIHVDGNAKDTFKKSRKSKDDKTRCNYHLCRKQRKLEQCPHCKNYYCHEHIKPFEPSLMSTRGHEKHEEGHPCAVYAEHKIHEKKAQDNKWGDWLAKHATKPSSGKKYKPKYKEDHRFDYVGHRPDHIKDARQKDKIRISDVFRLITRGIGKLLKFLFIIAIIAGLAYGGFILFQNYKPLIMEKLSKESSRVETIEEPIVQNTIKSPIQELLEAGSINTEVTISGKYRFEEKEFDDLTLRDKLADNQGYNIYFLLKTPRGFNKQKTYKITGLLKEVEGTKYIDVNKPIETVD